MLHWAPLQQRGDSGSPYSILDQLKFDKAILDKPEAKDGGFAEIEAALKLAKGKYGLGGITDVVLNHTASDSPWLEEHPEAGQWFRKLRSLVLMLRLRLLPTQHPSSRSGGRAGGRPP